MKVSLNWLKDYVDVEIPPKELAEYLTMAGLEVKELCEGEGGDVIFEIEVTPNRVDCLSVLGIAREVSAITGKELRTDSAKPCQSKICPPALSSSIKIEIQDREECRRYIGRVFRKVKIKPSPEWMQRRLLSLGIKPINNVVDITNYVMLEYGQPLHAFDLNKIREKIVVRKAKRGEKITTLDNEEKELDEEILIIADAQRPLAIAGIIGGEDCKVEEDTESVLLESAYFAPKGIRKASRRLGISTESSYRFERGVSLEGTEIASQRASALIEEFAQGELEGMILEGEEGKERRREIELRFSRVAQLLGMEVPRERIEEILRSLHFELEVEKEKVKVKVPHFRQDIAQESDLIEEVARIFGYQHIPLIMPKARLSGFEEKKEKKVEKRIKEILIASGFEEVITSSLISEKEIALINEINKYKERILSLANPLSMEEKVMRPELMFSLLPVLAWNLNHQVEKIKVFEIGKVYGRQKRIYEHKRLGMAMVGKEEEIEREKEGKNIWHRKSREIDFYDLKGAVEKLLLGLGVEDWRFTEEENKGFSPFSVTLKIKGRRIGVLGEVSRSILAYYEIEKRVYLCEIELNPLVEVISFQKKFVPIPKYPKVRRDIALLIKEEISCEQITEVIRESGRELINNVRLFDIYKGKQVPAGFKSLAFSIEYQHKDRTLTDEEVDHLERRVREQLRERLGAEVR